MPRQWVLKRGFDRVFASRRSVARGALSLRWASAAGKDTRIGISVARRAGNAVQRNRAKRRLRAIIRSLVGGFPQGYDIVVVGRPGVASVSYQELASTVQELLSRAGIWNGEEANGCAEGDRSPGPGFAH